MGAFFPSSISTCCLIYKDDLTTEQKYESNRKPLCHGQKQGHAVVGDKQQLHPLAVGGVAEFKT